MVSASDPLKDFGYHVKFQNYLSINSYNFNDISSFRAFQGLCINEFKGLQFDCQHSIDIQTGEQVGESMNFII